MNENYEALNLQMSLRTPQAESLRILSDIVAELPLTKVPDNTSALDIINGIDTPKKLKIKSFERDFPSICFSVATGVGKTRLMGAFIAYLVQEKGIKNFFIVAPNLTIYNKLIADFTPGTPKYVFKGVPEFAVNHPLITTGENYKDALYTSRMYDGRVKINIFNISKINRDKDSRGTPQFKKPTELLGESYFEYLQSLPDLVLLMDEAHRYRATAGMRVINELGAILGLEVTATAKTIGENAKDFKNIIYHYPLAQAIRDKYVKKPAIVGRNDWSDNKDKYDEAQLEKLKLDDGFYIHEKTKVKLEVFADEHNKRLVKPFLLIIARDTEHADELKEKIDSDNFRDGAYQGKVLVIHSNQKESEKDENIELLLDVEKTDSPIEVVIHVNMLAEGWDVNNLYTIIPLKPARTDILVEQSIGRGLRLPYGEHVGVDDIDQLNIVAHDKFNEIVKTAEKEGFAFQQRMIDAEESGRTTLVLAPTTFRNALTGATIDPSAPISAPAPAQGKMEFTFANQEQKDAAIAINDKLEEMGKIVSSPEELKSKEMQERIIAEIVQERKESGDLFAEEHTKVLTEVFKPTTEHFIESTIEIPQVSIYKAFPHGKSAEYNRFDLDLTPFDGLRPIQEKIIQREILGGENKQIGEAVFTDWQGATEDRIINELMDNNTAIPYNIVGTLRFFANQVTSHIKTYAADESEVRKIVFYNDKRIADAIFKQMEKNITEPEMEERVQVSPGYTAIRQSKLQGNSENEELDFRTPPKALSKIKQYIFKGFKKALSSKMQFDSDTERQLAVILESDTDVLRWEKLTVEQAKQKIPITYYGEDRMPRAYCPDFVVETPTNKYIIETKAEDQMTARDVTAKRDAAKRWCAEATKYEQSVGGKPWTYVLIPHTQFVADRSWDKLLADWVVK